MVTKNVRGASFFGTPCICDFISGFVSNKNFVSGFDSDFVSGRAFLTLPV